MKKFRILIALALCVASGLKAQEVQPGTPEENKPIEINDVKDINELKQSEQYVYGEVIDVLMDDNENVSLAQQKSIAKMQTHVIEIFGERLKMDKKDVQEIWDVIDDKCQNVIIKKGDLLRVLSYIAKDAIFGTKTKNPEDIKMWFPPRETVGPTTKTIVISESSESETSVLPAASASATGLPQSGIKEDPAPAPAPEDTVKTHLSDVPENVAVAPATPEQPKTAEAKPEPKPDPVSISQPVKVEPTPAPAPVVEVKVPALCQELMSQKTYGKLMAFLKNGKNRHELMYGNADTMQYLEKCYVIVVDKSTRAIVGVLDKGESDRMNFMTKKTDRYTNYKGGNYAVIFVQEY